MPSQSPHPQRPPPRSRRGPALLLAGAGLIIGLGLSLGSVLFLDGAAGVRYAGVARVELPVPPPSAAPAPSPPAAGEPARPQRPLLARTEPPQVGAAPADPAPPAEVDPALTEPGPYGPLPRAGADGRAPFRAYARRAPAGGDGGDGAKVALLITGLGLRAEVTAAALELPAPVGLVFSPYAQDLDRWMARARRAGHEVLLGLPMEPADYPDDDPGPHTLLADADAEVNLDRLEWVLARGEGYVGVAGAGERFAAAGAARGPVLAELARRGLALVEFGDDRLAATARELGLPYLSAPPPVDADPSALAIDFVLAGLEAEALETGTAVGVAEPYPVTLERLRAWIETLPAKGLELTPATALMGAGVSAERRGGVEAAQAPRG